MSIKLGPIAFDVGVSIRPLESGESTDSIFEVVMITRWPHKNATPHEKVIGTLAVAKGARMPDAAIAKALEETRQKLREICETSWMPTLAVKSNADTLEKHNDI
jgi:hypothetical protein